MNIEPVLNQAARRARTPLFSLVCLLGAAPAVAATTAPDHGQIERLARVRIPFVENCGQLDDRVAFSAPTFFGTVFVTRDGKLVYSLPKDESAGWTLTETLVSGMPRPAGGARASTGVSYFQGNDPKRWQSDLPTYEEVRLGEVWRGIAVSLRAHGGNVEKVFTIQPGARVEKIRLRLDGASSPRIDSQGALVAATSNGEIRFTAPEAYQEQNGARRPVKAAYVLHGARYGFRLGDYDPSQAVVIDPLLQATYLGSLGEDVINAMVVHPSTGEVFVAGTVGWSDFPGTSGGAQPTFRGDLTDGFVARLDPSLTTLFQATYLGGSWDFMIGDSGQDVIRSIAIEPTTGDVFVAGSTSSRDFPGTTGGAQPTFRGLEVDGFVAKLSAALTTLLHATYLGGSGPYFEGINAIAVHPSTGELVAAGRTWSDDFPGTAGGAQPAPGAPIPGGHDGFLARFDPALTTLLQATYLGGRWADWIDAIAVDPATGEVFAGGITLGDDFPGTTGGAQQTFGGGQDGFVVRLSPTLTTLAQATYLGGAARELVNAIALDPSTGDVIVGGQTLSLNFPGTIGGAQPLIRGYSDGFLARLNPALTTLLQATYLGGSHEQEGVSAIAVHPSTGDVFVGGATESTEFPGTSGGAQPGQYGSPRDTGFIARLNPAFTTILQATYLGGSGGRGETVKAITFHPTNKDVLVAGGTGSFDFPATGGGVQETFGGSGSDGFIACLTPDLTALISPVYLSVDPKSSPGDGNHVVEPGETVSIIPSWRNQSAEAYNPTGRASAIGGVIDAVHTIVKDTVSYGTILPGATGTAADGYLLNISQDFRRSLHRDAFFTETLDVPRVLPHRRVIHLGDSFADVARTYPFYEKIETLLHHGVTAGCTETTYCPEEPVSRAQMAIFIARAMAGGGGANVPESGTVGQSYYECQPTTFSLFVDVAGWDIFCKHVHYLAALNVTLGCGPSLYCPTPNVTRGEMAAFLARALVAPAGGAAVPLAYGPDPVTGLSYSCDVGSPGLHFADVSTSDSFCKHVHYLWAKGIIGGCSATEYCPALGVSRGAIGKFIANAFGLKLYGP